MRGALLFLSFFIFNCSLFYEGIVPQDRVDYDPIDHIVDYAEEGSDFTSPVIDCDLRDPTKDCDGDMICNMSDICPLEPNCGADPFEMFSGRYCLNVCACKDTEFPMLIDIFRVDDNENANEVCSYTDYSIAEVDGDKAVNLLLLGFNNGELDPSREDYIFFEVDSPEVTEGESLRIPTSQKVTIESGVDSRIALQFDLNLAFLVKFRIEGMVEGDSVNVHFGEVDGSSLCDSLIELKDGKYDVTVTTDNGVAGPIGFPSTNNEDAMTFYMLLNSSNECKLKVFEEGHERGDITALFNAQDKIEQIHLHIYNHSMTFVYIDLFAVYHICK